MYFYKYFLKIYSFCKTEIRGFERSFSEHVAWFGAILGTSVNRG